MKKILLSIITMAITYSSAQCAYDINADSVQLKNGTLILSGNVCLTVDNTLIKGQRAVYDAGTVILYPDEEHSYCSISNEEGLDVKMDKGVYTPDSQELVLINPEGKMKWDVDGAECYLHFQSKLLLWDNANQQLTLIDEVNLQVPGIASLTNDDRVSLSWSKISGKRTLNKMTSSGKSQLQKYGDGGDPLFIVDDEGITCYDVIDGRVSFTSDNDQEIHYYDRLGHVFGRELFVDLQPNTITFAPKKVFLNKNVKLLTGVIVVEGELKGATQYVLADSLVLNPKNKTLVMLSDPKNRVLFCDRMNHLQMSAPKVVMRKNPGMDTPTVKGVGDVRFRLKEKELKQIKKRFYLDEGEQES